MGAWKVLSVVGQSNRLDHETLFGTNWRVKFRLQYTPSKLGLFVEPPKMAWDEIILTVDRKAGTYSELSDNMYTRKPDSPTVAVWPQRYIRAYLNAHNLPQLGWGGRVRGYSRLFDNGGQRVTGAELGTHAGLDARNRAVQNYLKRHGGILEIEVHDMPSLIKPTAGAAKNIERLLIFNCGVTGMGPRVKAWQLLMIDSSQPPARWTCDFQINGAPPAVKTTGLRQVSPVHVPQSNTLPTGGIW